jgi:predicted CXXCH cytochrome family protein
MDSRLHGQTEATGVQKPSTRSPVQMEYELCEGCHGGTGITDRDPLEVSGRLNPRNASHHAVEAPSRGSVPSIRPDLAGKSINCTDCHGNSDPNGIKGPHGSAERFILRAAYATIDGNGESAATYALCYECHDREKVLSSTLFPEHRRHVVDQRASCATCHDAHGSVNNRALIHIGEQSIGVAPSASASTGMLAFQSSMPGSGTCFLTCHGYDHAGSTYGGLPSQ